MLMLEDCIDYRVGVLTVVAAGVDGKLDLLGLVLWRRAGLCSAERADVVGSADVELVVVGRERLQLRCLDLVVISTKKQEDN